jgi:hypothetical protein
MTSFLKELYLEFEHGAEQRELSLAEEEVVKNYLLNEFEDEIWYLISEAY